MTLKHCCCCFDHRQGVMVLAVVLGLISVAGVVFGGFQLANAHTQIAIDISLGSLISGSVMTLANFLLFVGCSKDQRHFFIPWLVLVMLQIVAYYIMVLVLSVIGIMSLFVSETTRNHYYYADGEIYSGDQFSVIFGLSGVWAIIVAIGVLLGTILWTYFWAVVQHLYRKMAFRGGDHVLLIEDGDDLRPVDSIKK